MNAAAVLPGGKQYVWDLFNDYYDGSWLAF